MAKKIKQSPKLPAETRRGQLLASAQRLFVRKGYRGTTTDEIARKAGLTKGGLYFHFKSKESILFELVRGMMEDKHGDFDARLERVSSPAEYFDLLMAHHQEHHFHDSWEVVDIWVQAMRIPRIKRYMANKFDELLDRTVEVFKRRSDLSRKEIRQQAIHVIALHDGMSIFEMMRPAAIDVKYQRKLVERMFDKTAPLRQSSGAGSKRKKKDKK